MQEVLALALQSMQTDMQKLDRVGTNLANALTTGYQREVLASQPMGSAAQAFSAVVEGMQAQPSGTAAAAMPSLKMSSMLAQTDMRPGTLKSTGQSLDVALAGPGYFEVMTESGPAYTRQGAFRVDARGRLVSSQGHPVMGKGGEINLNGDRPFIDAVGNVFESRTGTMDSTTPVAQIKVLQPEDSKSMQRLGEGLFSADGSFAAVKESDIQIRQGFLENSNVNSMQEMVQLMQTMRHFESMQKVALGYDDMTGQAVRKLGELS